MMTWSTLSSLQKVVVQAALAWKFMKEMLLIAIEYPFEIDLTRVEANYKAFMLFKT